MLAGSKPPRRIYSGRSAEESKPAEGPDLRLVREKTPKATPDWDAPSKTIENLPTTFEVSMRVGRHVEALIQDLRFSIRLLLRERAFTVAVLVTLALEHWFDDRGVHPGRRPAASASAGQLPGKTLQHLRAREKRRPQSLGTTRTGSTSICGPRVLSSATCWRRRPPFHPASTCPTVPSRIACGASSYPGTTSTSSALARRRGGS